MRFAGLLGFLVASSAWCGPMQVEHLVEREGWKADIQIECYSQDQQCGQFRFEATGCSGNLLYRGEHDGGYVFQEKLESGRCLPNCELWIAEGMDRYRESCRGQLAGSGTLAMGSKPKSVPLVDRTPVASVGSLSAEVPEQVIAAGTTIYRGKFRVNAVSGVVDGQGKVEWSNGNRYEGPVVGGKLTGKARFEWKNGDHYEGNVLNAEPHGLGTYFWKSGERYVGAWRNGRKHGQGRYYFEGGDYWEGEYANDQQTANGRLIWAEQKEKLSTASNNVVLLPDEPAGLPRGKDSIRNSTVRAAVPKKIATQFSACARKLAQCMEICGGLIDTGENSPAQVCRKRCDTEFASCQSTQ